MGGSTVLARRKTLSAFARDAAARFTTAAESPSVSSVAGSVIFFDCLSILSKVSWTSLVVLTGFAQTLSLYSLIFKSLSISASLFLFAFSLSLLPRMLDVLFPLVSKTDDSIFA